MWRFPHGSAFFERLEPTAITQAFAALGAKREDQIWLRGMATGWNIAGPGGTDWVHVPNSRTAPGAPGYIAQALQQVADLLQLDAMALYCPVLRTAA